uniref:Uncharacterized protein n=1 Tax=Arundo donax TaxID=35708 RepID=A0A0A9CFZ9_ARUDO
MCNPVSRYLVNFV